ncbi:hypothetical protein PsorP6_010771 [Peronosclerospora sorghi]|uniref:Uncharacterized protein n=1 Tax=Peronosclerospora sorghi TaxID=230839 RepID=A0ACC0VXZ9_9STRA|nr:hypothetical protein PsorP6_010771 [Peronosclerospora sorghi]
MMQEILELLATNSPKSGQTPTTTTSESSGTIGNTPRNEDTSRYEDKIVSKRLGDIVTLSSGEKIKAGESQERSREVRTSESTDERESPIGHKKRQQETQEIHNSIPDSPMPLDDYNALIGSSVSSTPSRAFIPQYFDENPSIVADTYANPSATVRPLSIAAPLETKTSPDSKDVSTSSTSHSTGLSSGQRVHVMDSAEFDELRRKLRMQTASRRYRKRKKDQSRQQKMQIQELQVELAHLQEVEAQWKQYSQRSEESLEKELDAHKNAIASLEKKIQEAQEEEVEWVKLMSRQLFKQ